MRTLGLFSWPLLPLRTITAVTALGLAAVCSAAQSQDPSERVRKLLSTPLSNDTQKLRAEVVAFGNDAVEPLAESIANRQALPIRIAFLIDTLAALKSVDARVALTTFLRDSRPFVRAYTALSLGRAKAYCAIPAIIPLLRDSSAYVQEVSTDPYRERTVTVSEAALKSLEQLTGLKVRRRTGAKQIGVYQRHWADQGSHLNCVESY